MVLENPKLFEDDKLHTPEVGAWAITKYKKIEYYASVFARSMKNRWDYRVYIDLFAGAGKNRVKGSDEIIPGSPLIALSIKDPFDHYIFYEEDLNNLDALQKRVEEFFPEHKSVFILGDVNDNISNIHNELPPFSKEFKGLTLCFIDPFKMGALNFNTIKQITNALYVDILVLIPSYMDINRNEQHYTRDDDPSLDNYLGTREWRALWPSSNRPGISFGEFIAEEFCKQMKNLGFIYENPEDMEIVRMDTGNRQPLYHLAFFSKNRLGLKFWRETKQNTNPQGNLW